MSNWRTLFKYMSDHSELVGSYNNWMVKQSELQNAAVLASYDFSGHHMIVDVGGGQGPTLVSILRAHPHVRAVLFDLPQVVTHALVPDTLAERYEIVAGDMLHSVPAGGDAYLLKRVLMDWSDEVAIKVLKNCREAMQPDGKILVIETVVPEGNEPSVSKILDLIMLALQHGGRVRTEVEHRALLEAAGLELTHVIPTPSPLSLLEGVRR